MSIAMQSSDLDPLIQEGAYTTLKVTFHPFEMGGPVFWRDDRL